jgi:hypothetical protein
MRMTYKQSLTRSHERIQVQFLRRVRLDGFLEIAMKKRLLTFLCVSILTSLLFLSYKSSFVRSETTHLVISEIQVGGATTNDEFIELYNPTNSDVDITGWKLRKKTSTGTESALVASISGTIKSHGYFLIVNPEVSANYQYDNLYSSASYAIANNNTVILEDTANTEIDKVGFGTPADYETQAALSPSSGESIERKATETSTLESMTVGVDVTNGNSYDSDNNYNDFILRNIPDPQGSASPIEPSNTEPTSTETPTEVPTLTPEPTDLPTQTPEPTLTPTPTELPTSTPSSSPTPTEEPTPTEILTETPIPTQSPTITPEPTPTPSGQYYFSFLNLSCRFDYPIIRFGFLRMHVPVFSCLRSK